MIEGRPKESLVQFDNPIEVSFIFLKNHKFLHIIKIDFWWI